MTQSLDKTIFVSMLLMLLLLLLLTPAMERSSPKEFSNSQRPDLGPGHSLYLRGEARQPGGGGVALVAVPPPGNYLFAVNNGASA